MTLPLRRTVPLLSLLAVLSTGTTGARAQAGNVSPAREPQISGNPEQTLQVYAYTFQHKDAVEALTLIRPLLSKKGTVELQPEGNTLVLRDTLAALGRILPALRAFDRPPQELRIEIMIVRAGTRPSPRVESGTEHLPGWLEERLRSLLRWDHYALLARSGVDTREGQEVTHELGSLYGLSFRPGTLMAGDRLKLHDFRIWRIEGTSGNGAEVRGESLLEATLNLWLKKPKVLGLANSESSDRALMVVLTCETREPPRREENGERQGGGG